VEQSLCVETDKGIVIIVGCSHPGIDHILTVSRRFGNIYGIIGGLHGFRDFELFSDFGLICATHCTQHKKEIEDLYPETFTRGGAGRIITI
jgi:7,8-dihydropterin-6-yl-methyl-4-(beta-D-ribofuranosyl)aminobenzene 5'-phosphate synthase